MPKYVKTNVTNGMLVTPAVKKELDTTPKTDVKSFQRERITNEVFDLEDSVADNAKMISLLMSMISRLYPLINTTTLAASDKALIDGVLAEFAVTNTRADVQMAKEGPSMVSKILARQAAIGAIVA